MAKTPTKEEINERILKSGVDARTNDEYINAVTPMEFFCSKGHVWKTKLGNITHNHQGCPYCCGRYFIQGESDLYTVYPEVARLLLGPDEGKFLSKCSGQKKKFKCPFCGLVSEHIVSNVVKRGFSCPACSDGISYPNKFAASMFRQLDVKFIHEFIFEGASYKYDFYLPEFNVIVEMHGRQHYEQWSKSSRTLEEEQLNDKNKMDFAINKNIKHYVVVDSRNSDICYISKNILKSYLNDILDLSMVDWRECGYFASGSLVHASASLYNSKYSICEISIKLGYTEPTIRRWLKKATDIGLCEYLPGKGFLKDNKNVILLNTKEIFYSVSEAGRIYGIPLQNISKNCKHQRSYAGFDFNTGLPLVWRFLDEYDENETIDFKLLINPRAHYSDSTKLIKEVS